MPTGRVVVSTRETAMKVKHLARDPQVAICVLNDGFFGEWVQVEGTAEVVHLPEAMDGLVEYYRRSRASTPTGTTTAPRWSASGGSWCGSRVTRVPAPEPVSG